jgi:hypothetical protein
MRVSLEVMRHHRLGKVDLQMISGGPSRRGSRAATEVLGSGALGGIDPPAATSSTGRR